MNTSTNQLHVVVGAGAVGSGTALRLAEAGHRVRVITRSGAGPTHAGIECIAADAVDTNRLNLAATGAHAIYNCANPPYHRWPTAWPPLAASLLTAAEVTGARLVTMGNLYVYAPDSSPMRPTDQLRPPTRKGAIRVAMWTQAMAAHEAGRARITEVRASDFFGPGLGDQAHLGDRFVPRLVNGKRAMVVTATDVAHSWSYIGDVCDTLLTVGTDDRSLGRAWHVPTVAPRTVNEMAAAICEHVGVPVRAVRRIPRSVLRAAGLFSPVLREMPEMLYQFDEPFVIDAAETTATFGLEPTPLTEQIAKTVAAQRPGRPKLDAPTVDSITAA